jgi:peptidoglycan DL-endopeptidase CwlO
MGKLSYIRERLKLKKITSKSSVVKIGFMVALVAASGPASIVSVANADRYQEQINELRQKNQETSAEQTSLQLKEENLAKAIADLRGNIASIEAQISKNKSKNAALEKSIRNLERDIEAERETLGINIRQMYLDDQMTTIEKLASSKNLSEYVDKEQYRVAVQSKVQESMSAIAALKEKQESQKTAIEKLVKDQEGMQKELASQRKENERLIKINRGQQSEYASEVRENNSRIAELRRQQAIENQRHFISQTTTASAPSNSSSNNSSSSSNSTPARSQSSSGGSSQPIGYGRNYPWANVAFPNSMPDPWGMYKRQCVSYTAWRVASSGRHMPYWGGRGNAKLWANNARRAGIPVDYTPRVGSIAVSTAGTYGHVMYVEAVHGDGTITISDYNAGWDGRYREGRRTTTGLQFVHFR